ncbi:MAG TPA: FAD-dependent oxidoreductase [Vicinamibacterales bacterium]|nr:FAD-dependent oxidoreductase [Vicinamibacterales bacterium]
MKRDLDRLREPFDLIVIGAGIYGAAIAWDATLRGLHVALIDRGDIGGGTSFNNAKTLHGGVRSLQGLRLDELREYVRERRALLRIAPHLVRPLTFVTPALGTLTRNRLAYTAYFRAYDLLARDRNDGVDPALHLGGTRLLGREAYLALDPLSDPARVRGGVAWQDGQMVHGERVTLAFVKAAAARGAVIATYLRANTALVDGGRVRGVRCDDMAPQLVGAARAIERALDISAPLVVNATGPQCDRVAAALLGGALPRLVPVLSLALNVVTRPLGLDAAVAGTARGRLFFAAPWRGVTIAGTGHEGYDGTADDAVVPPADVDTFLRDFNLAFPRAGLTRADIRLVHRGLLPTAAVVDGEVRLLKTSVIRDHADDGHPGMISVVGTRYTTARHTAQLAVDRVFAALGRPAPPCLTATTPLAGGDVGHLAAFLSDARRLDDGVDRDAGERLARLYGTEHTAVRRLMADGPLGEPLSPTCPTFGAEVVHAMREEMAVTLADALLRRTEAGVTGHPGRPALERAAAIMAFELGWPPAHAEAEIAACERVYDVP